MRVATGIVPANQPAMKQTTPVPQMPPTSIYADYQEYRPHTRTPHRSFYPKKGARYGLPEPFPMDKLVKFSPKYGYSRLFNFPFRGASWRPRMNTVVVQVHGIATPNSATDPNSKATGGVYFGRGAPNNIHFNLPKYMPQTNSRAILEAVRTALNELIAMRHTRLDPRWKECIIMTNSDYAKKSLDEYVWVWEKNGWNHMQQSNKPIEHLTTMQELHNLITYMETTLNMAVRFWKVDREDLEGADNLAQLAMRVPTNSVIGVQQMLAKINV